jgi:hypothetical protein
MCLVCVGLVDDSALAARLGWVLVSIKLSEAVLVIKRLSVDTRKTAYEKPTRGRCHKLDRARPMRQGFTSFLCKNRPKGVAMMADPERLRLARLIHHARLQPGIVIWLLNVRT